MESVRAKFTVASVTHYADTSSVTLSPVINGSDENKQFYKWTPGGSIELQVVSPDVADHFVPGDEYYVDFTPANTRATSYVPGL